MVLNSEQIVKERRYESEILYWGPRKVLYYIWNRLNMDLTLGICGSEKQVVLEMRTMHVRKNATKCCAGC